MSTRALRPNVEAISEDPPSAFDLESTAKLERYMAVASPQESTEEQQKRAHVLSSLAAIFEDWVRSVCLSKGLSPEAAAAAGGALFTSGSYRLGVNERGMDIDTICVAPRSVTREDFFFSLKVILEDHDSVTNLNAVESAIVPIITFDFDEINVDLLFASVNADAVPKDFDINNDEILKGIDQGTEKSLNGPRVTNMIEKLVPFYPAFISVLRCVRLWAKRRGIYGNKFGYFGGVNCNILVAFVCQLYPKAAASLLLERFFFILSDWSWPTPVMLTPPYDAGIPGLECWNPQTGHNRYHVMPILTPAYPSMNSSMSVSQWTLEVMWVEMCIAHEKVGRILASGADDWDELFAPVDFWTGHQKYIGVEIYIDHAAPPAQAEDLLRAWSGFVESRLRKLVEYLSALPLSRIRLMPKKLPIFSEKLSGCAGISYLVGFDVDRDRMRGEELHLSHQTSAFKHEVFGGAMRVGLLKEESEGWQQLKFTTFASWKNLPNEIVEATVGSAEAMIASRKRVVAARRAARISTGEENGGGETEGGAQKRTSVDDDATGPAAKQQRTEDDPLLPAADPRLGGDSGLEGEAANGANGALARGDEAGCDGADEIYGDLV